MHFLERLDENIRTYADKLALEFLDPPLQTLTYAELDAVIRQSAAYLVYLGVQPGDRVALQLPKCLEFIVLHLASIRIGAITLPLNTAYPAAELSYFLEDSEARLFFGDENARLEIESTLAQLPTLERHTFLDHRSPSQFVLMIYTSGTTGRPKGAMITAGNLTSNLDALHTAWGWRSDDLLLHALPMFHVHGLITSFHGALHAGASTLALRKFDARRVLQLLVDRKCSVFMGVPTIYQRILAVPDAVNISNPLEGERRMGSVGLPLPGVEARIVDPETEEPLPDGQAGAVQIRGPNVFKEYWRQPEKTAAAFSPHGWLRTGDLGLREPDGYFTLKGRAKDLIITGGFNVYPPEVERVLNEHYAVKTGVVIGCPDADWGERVVAVVVTEPRESVSAEDLVKFCRERLAAYKCPKEIIFTQSLPRNAMGKVQKVKLRQELCG
jgi:malonyl-CoA/methylmalonyl-CoA synthetase